MKDDVVGIAADLFRLLHAVEVGFVAENYWRISFDSFFSDKVAAKLYVAAVESIIENLPKPGVVTSRNMAIGGILLVAHPNFSTPPLSLVVEVKRVSH